MSIYNKYGEYGSPYNNKSAFNPYASNPPIIRKDDNTFVAYLTNNTYINPRVDSISFMEWMNYKR